MTDPLDYRLHTHLLTAAAELGINADRAHANSRLWKLLRQRTANLIERDPTLNRQDRRHLAARARAGTGLGIRRLTKTPPGGTQ